MGNDTETINFGNFIQLSGFRELDGGKVVILKKIIGNHVKKISDHADKLENISLVMKPVHEKEKSKIFELHAKAIDNGKVYSAESTERNIFITVDQVLTKLYNEVKKK